MYNIYSRTSYFKIILYAKKIIKSKVLNTGLLRTEKTRGLEMILNMT